MRVSGLLLLVLFHTVGHIFSVKGIQTYQNQGKLSDNPIKIGLLVQSNKSLDARQGTEVAITIANEKVSIKGRKFELVIRSMEGPWGTGSKEAVNLIFDEKVYAIIGSHDGRNAHLVEQVAAKSRTNYLSAWASDPSLSQAFVPWFFNCVPNNLQQASSLIKEIYLINHFKKVAIVSDKSYDANLAVKSFLNKIKTYGIMEPMQFSSGKSDLSNLTERINKSGVQCIVLFGEPSYSWNLIQLMRSKKMNQTIYGSLFALGEKEVTASEYLQNGKIVLISSEYYMRAQGKAFLKEYERIYGEKPTEASAYAFDAANIIMEAIRNAGYDRENIKTELKKIRHEGVTGLIQFDEKGNRIGDPGLIEITNGKAVEIDR